MIERVMSNLRGELALFEEDAIDARLPLDSLGAKAAEEVAGAAAVDMLVVVVVAAADNEVNVEELPVRERAELRPMRSHRCTFPRTASDATGFLSPKGDKIGADEGAAAVACATKT